MSALLSNLMRNVIRNLTTNLNTERTTVISMSADANYNTHLETDLSRYTSNLYAVNYCCAEPRIC